MGYLNVDPATLGPTAHLNGCCGASDARPGLPGLKPIGVGLYDAQVVSPAMPGVGIGVYDADVVTDQPLRSVKPKRVVCLDRHRLPVAITPTNGPKLDLVPVGVVPGAQVVNVGQGPGNGVGYGQHAGGVGYYMPHPGLSGLGEVSAAVIDRTKAYYKNARLAALRNDRAEAERLFRMAEGDATYNGFANDPRISDEREYARQAIMGSAQEQRAALADTKVGRELLAKGRENARPDSVTGAFAGSLYDDASAALGSVKDKLVGLIPGLPWWVVPAIVVGGGTWLLLPRAMKGAALFWRHSNPRRRYHAKRRRSA